MNNNFSTLQVGQDLKFSSEPGKFYRVFSNEVTNKKVVIMQIYPRSNNHQNIELTYQQLKQYGAELTEALITCENCYGSGQVDPMPSIGMSRVQQNRICKYCGGTGKMKI